ncbi:MAG: shikimate kinase AroL [Candidatus Adiutrix sp.]|jgi:shikimate kinase|nr:shikimate kinase AroL [Candidatus Adiutrix sp.]
MKAEKTIFLIGPRAAGKTVVGEKLATALRRGFADTDQRLSQSRRASLAELIQQEGWEAFRQMESQTLREVTAPGLVIATGGGMVLAEANRAFMRERGLVFYLSAPAGVLAARLAADPRTAFGRPSLTGRPITEEVAQVVAEREALYRAATHHIIDASGSPDDVAASIAALLAEIRQP